MTYIDVVLMWTRQGRKHIHRSIDIPSKLVAGLIIAGLGGEYLRPISCALPSQRYHQVLPREGAGQWSAQGWVGWKERLFWLEPTRKMMTSCQLDYWFVCRSQTSTRQHCGKATGAAPSRAAHATRGVFDAPLTL